MNWDRFFFSLDRLRLALQDFLGGRPQALCRLHTDDGDGVLVADDGSQVSVLHVHGLLRLMGEDEYEQACEVLTRTLATPLAGRGHAIQIVFACDPEEAQDELAASLAPVRAQAKGLGLDLAAVLEDWSATMAGWCAAEAMYLVVWTRPELMPAAERRQIANDPSAGPRLEESGSMRMTRELPRLRDAHCAVCQELVDKLRSITMRVELLDSHAAVRAVRRCIAPRWTSGDWRPVLAGDRLPVREPVPGARADAADHVVPPSLACQVWPLPAVVHEGRFVEVDDRLYAPFVMSMPPQTVLPFASLFRSLLSETLPFRLAVLLTGDGLRGQGLRSAAASVLSFCSATNRRLQRSFTALRELALAGETCVGLQISLVTWVRLDGLEKMDEGTGKTLATAAIRDLATARALLSRRAARLAAAVQAWGSCDTAMVTGDPVQAYLATVPAMTWASPAVRAIAPLSEAVHLLPLFRPCSPWTSPDVPLRSPDGRCMPVSLFSPAQASWNEICFAGMGSGKSFLLNTLNLFFVLRPGQARLPWLTVIDIGQSCSGLIDLVRAALPPSMRHLAVFARLRNSRDAAINPFDTLLGCPKPLASHAGYLVNLLSLLCTPLSETAPADGVTDLLREALDAVYRRLAPGGESPRRYDPHAEPLVSGWLTAHAVPMDKDVTWWEIVRLLFEAGERPLAAQAQRHAVPLLADLMAELNNPLLRDRFAGIHERGSSESVPEACVRHLSTAIRDYPLLAAPTRFSLGTARIVGLDLTEVTPRGGPAAERQSGIMYMVARFVGAAHFFNTLDDLALVPDFCREWHRQRIEDLVASPKRLCYDEFHRASCADMNNPLSRQIIADLTTASREARKQNLAICLYSQQLTDYPKVLVDLATCVYAMGAGNASEAAEISARFGFNQAARYALRNSTRPTRAGASFIALYRTAHGEAIQQLTCTAGAYARWAFSTTAEDMRVRNRLYEEFGCAKTLTVLKTVYPEGTVREDLERRKQRVGTTTSDGAEDLVLAIVEELRSKAREMALAGTLK